MYLIQELTWGFLSINNPVIDLIGVFISLIGLGGFSGDIVYQNQSQDNVYVRDVSGFVTWVECGNLISAGEKGMGNPPMSYPRTTTIRFKNITKGTKPEEVTLKLDAGYRPSRKSKLVFVFTPEGKWTAHFEDSQR